MRPLRTGTENYSLHLIRALLKAGGGHHYRLYFNLPVGHRQPPPFPPGPWEARVIPFPRLWTHLRLSWEMAQHPPDLLFVPAHVLPLLHPRRSVVTVHDLGFRFFPQAHRTLDRWYLEWSTRYHARAAAHLLADSEATKRDLIELYGVPPERITVVYPGRDESLQPVADPDAIAQIKKRYGIGGEYILHIGTLHPRKNLAHLVEAFALLREGLPQGSAWRLVLAGRKGWLYEPLFRRIAELGLEEEVIFTGYVPQPDLAPLLSGARCFAFPSLYEGFGFPVLEAMSCGTPVVCSNASSLPEVAGDAALLVDPQDTQAWAEAMERVLTDGELRRSLIQRGY
ncbi:MAG: glycosyltransferase family 1 protein, partial [Chloroflexota bacterium]|nr:glycosyltransferase family 1 protein [Chloroflexota bacterium]